MAVSEELCNLDKRKDPCLKAKAAEIKQLKKWDFEADQTSITIMNQWREEMKEKQKGKSNEERINLENEYHDNVDTLGKVQGKRMREFMIKLGLTNNKMEQMK